MAGSRSHSFGQGGAEERGRGGVGGGDLLGGAGSDDPAAVGTGVGADFEEPVGRLEDVEIVLDHDHAVAVVHEGLQDGEQALHVVAVEAGRWLIQQEQRSCWMNQRRF